MEVKERNLKNGKEIGKKKEGKENKQIQKMGNRSLIEKLQDFSSDLLSSTQSFLNKKLNTFSDRRTCACEAGLSKGKTCKRAFEWLHLRYKEKDLIYLKKTYETLKKTEIHSSTPQDVNSEGGGGGAKDGGGRQGEQRGGRGREEGERGTGGGEREGKEGGEVGEGGGGKGGGERDGGGWAEVHSQIEKDLDRTFPNDGFCEREKLRNVLETIAKYDPQIGYVQGMNFIAGFFLFHAEEYVAFWLMVMVFETAEFRDVYQQGKIKQNNRH